MSRTVIAVGRSIQRPLGSSQERAPASRWQFASSALVVGLATLVLITTSTAWAASGDLDPTFGHDGVVRTQLTRAEEDGFAVAIQLDGKIVVAGGQGLGGRNPRFAIVRYRTDGSPDPSFGDGDGTVSVDFTPRADFAYAVRIQPDGKIVVAGAASYFGGKSRFALARLTSAGALDPTFGGDGKVMTNVTPSYDWANGMALQSDGRIVVVGSLSAGATNGEIGVLRYLGDGSLDPSFGAEGIVRTDPTTGPDDGLAIGVEADGRIVVAGGANFERFVAVAYRPDGALDPTFGEDGMVFTDLTTKTDVPYALAIQDDGAVVMAGAAAVGRDTRFAVVRYERDGSLDGSFGGDGLVITNVTATGDTAYAVAIAPDGKIAATGLADDAGDPLIATVRLLVDGSLDATFGGDGTVTTDLTKGYDSGYGVAVQTDGSIVCSGVSGASGSHARLAVLRYEP
jgi:uncharacterized delta-60 repeat protein